MINKKLKLNTYYAFDIYDVNDESEVLTTINNNKSDIIKCCILNSVLGKQAINEIYKFDNLRELRLINCNIKYISLDILNLKNLKVLNITRNNISLISTLWIKNLDSFFADVTEVNRQFTEFSPDSVWEKIKTKQEVLDYWQPLDDYRSTILYFIWGKPCGLPKDIAKMIGKIA